MPTEHANGASPLGRSLSFLRGDRYMVGAYPPEWHGETPQAPADPHGATATPGIEDR